MVILTYFMGLENVHHPPNSSSATQSVPQHSTDIGYECITWGWWLKTLPRRLAVLHIVSITFRFSWGWSEISYHHIMSPLRTNGVPLRPTDINYECITILRRLFFQCYAASHGNRTPNILSNIALQFLKSSLTTLLHTY